MDLNKLKKRDLEQLSAYLDGELSESESRKVDARLQSDSQFQAAFEELEKTRVLISGLPTLSPPRNFTLTPEMVGVRKGLSLFPVFRFATVIAAAAFAVLVGANVLLLQGPGGVPLAAEPARMVVEEEPQPEAAIEEPVEGVLEAPMEDAVIGTASEEAGVPVEGLEEQELAPSAGGELPTQTESGFDRFGPDAGETFAQEGTKVEITATPETEGTDESTLNAADMTAEPTSAGVVEPTITPTEEIRPTPSPVFPDGLRPSVDPVRAVEIGLATLVVLSAAITWVLRKAR
jgi:hypothetical protein